MERDAVEEDHEIDPAGAVKVPLIEGITSAGVKAMVHVNVGSGKVVRHVTEERTNPVLKDVANRVRDPRLVQRRVVAFLVSKGVCTAHHTAAEADPRKVVQINLPPGEVALSELRLDNVDERNTPGKENHHSIGEEVCVDRTGINVLGSKGANRLVVVEILIDGTEEL